MKWHLMVWALLLAVPSSRAGVPIARKDRVRNRPEDRCGWCALETLARYHKVTALYGLADQHATRATSRDLTQALDEANVDYRVQDAGNHKTFILKYAVREKLGAAVGFRERTPGAGRHMVILVDFGPEEVCVIDPNDRDGRIRTMSLKRFLSWWDGFALLIDPAQEE